MPTPPEAPCIWIAGGGTGGHLYPGLSLAAAIQKENPSAQILFVGTQHGLDADLVPRHGFKLACLSTGRGSPLSWRSPLNIFRFLRAYIECRRLFHTQRPQAVVSLGGFAASVPGLLAAWKGVPLILLEQNVLPGRVTRLLARWAREIHMQFGEARAHLYTRGEMHDSGSPARSEIAALAKKQQKTHQDGHQNTESNTQHEGTRLLIMGGSQGAQRLNEMVRDAMPALVKAGVPVTHITGERDYDLVAPAYAGFSTEQVRLLRYVDDMASELADSRMALVRAGASSINDLELAAIPSILIPYPHARDDHQTANAVVLEREGAADVWIEADLTPEKLAEGILALWNNSDKLAQMQNALCRRARPDAANVIARSVLACAAAPDADKDY